MDAMMNNMGRIILLPAVIPSSVMCVRAHMKVYPQWVKEGEKKIEDFHVV